MTFPYVYYWNRQDRKGQFCRVTARGKMNSCCAEFEDGYKMITSRNAIRKRKDLCRNCRDPIDDGHPDFCGMCREMGAVDLGQPPS